jgi:hypothetical protein
MQTSRTLDLVLTSIINNESIFKSIVEDMQERFKIQFDKQQLHNFLNVAEFKVVTNNVES